MAGPRVSQTTDYALGTCPSCSHQVTAKVSVEVTIGGVVMRSGKPSAEAISQIVGVEVHHVCTQLPKPAPPDDEDVYG